MVGRCWRFLCVQTSLVACPYFKAGRVRPVILWRLIDKFARPAITMKIMENEEQKKGDPDLSTRIYATRKARIHAEERLLRYGLLSKLALASYALASVILGIGACFLDIIYDEATMMKIGEMEIGPPGQVAGWMSLLVAVVLLPISTLVSAQRFSERALLMRACYVHLTQLAEDERAQGDNCEKKAEIFKSFCLILALTENHHEMDYQAHKRKEGDGVKFHHALRICLHWVSHCLWYVPGVILPIFIVVGFFYSVFTL